MQRWFSSKIKLSFSILLVTDYNRMFCLHHYLFIFCCIVYGMHQQQQQQPNRLRCDSKHSMANEWKMVTQNNNTKSLCQLTYLYCIFLHRVPLFYSLLLLFLLHGWSSSSNSKHHRNGWETKRKRRMRRIRSQRHLKIMCILKINGIKFLDNIYNVF